jgi:DtxR family transcriptional regulator, iron-dependent repressor
MALPPWECKSVAGIRAEPPRRITGPRLYSSVVAEMHDATEEYLETILEIEEEGVPPIRARLVERLGISAPAGSETVNRLVEQGYAQLLDDRSLRLTPKGRALAVSIVRRHRLAERLLTDVIGLEWEKVHREADRWEHAISADVEEKLVQLLGDPATCPHGNPIPGSKHRVDTRGALPLAKAVPGSVRVTRISEKAELDDDALSFLARAQLVPGSEAVVVGPAAGGVAVKSGVGEQTVPARLAELMWVTAA